WFLTTPGVFPWPAFITIFWGIGVVSHAIGTYFSHHYTETLAEKEYQRMTRGRRP
ncbi:MAG: 2TM domain-containing protein, partial [Euryarchaeota archaeon]|nr:2TM domain-containing protein [Euryarchaeota archaeon]